MKLYLELRKIFKERELPSEEVISSYDNIEASVTTDLIRGSRVDAVLVDLFIKTHILSWK